MVVPSCLRSPVLRFSAACRSVSTSTATATSTCNNNTTIHVVSNMKSILRANGSTAVGSTVNGSLRCSNYSTLNIRTAVEEDAGLLEVLNAENGKSKLVSGASHAGTINVFAEASERAWSNLQSRKSEGTPSTSDYLNTLRKLSEARDFTRCRTLLDEIKSAGIQVDAEMYSLVLNAGRRTLRSNEIRELFGDNTDYLQRKSHAASFKDSDSAQESSSSAVPVSHTIFYDQFEAILKEMKDSNIRPTVQFYEELANFLTAINQAGVLINLATAMEKRGETPSAKFYNRMLHCLPRCGLLDRASMLFNRMVLKGKADYYTYLVRASSLVYVNQMEAARAVLSDMKGKFEMDPIAFNILIKSYLAQGNCEQAVQVFKQMTRDPSNAPNRVTCRTFLSYFYETANLTHSEPIVGYFETANFPETFEDYGNVIKFFARYDPPKVLDLFKQLKGKLSAPGAEASDKNQVHHAFLRVLNDRQVTSDWKKSFANLILDGETGNNQQITISASTLNAPELPFHFRMIIDRIESPDSATYEIVLKKLIQLRRYDSVKSLYQSMFYPENTHNVSAQPVHRNLYLTALLAGRELEAAREFIVDLHNRRIPISGKNTTLLEEAGIELPRGALTAKKGQGVTVNRTGGNNYQQRTFNNNKSVINNNNKNEELNFI